ncbi:MAG: carboxypeptidase regulatory-like domain-containing protein [Acidobacteria bacterium]|nr:carboxypeptidase regulatory-like domain-containing protein [Acidobacteriota bacterium]
MKRILFTLMAALMLAPAPAAAQQKQKQYADLKFRVVKKHNGKPLRNASIVLHAVNEKGEQQKGGYQIKTATDGTTSFDSAPYGKLRVQVIATGFQTFGEDFDINQPTHEFVIRMNRPQEQHSIYEKKPEEKKAEGKPKQ